MIDAFSVSTLTVALAEIGDKTQLLSLALTARFRNKWGIIAGILVATLANHGASAWLGQWLAGFFQSTTGSLLIAGSFLLLAAWLLIPDEDDDLDNHPDRYGAFLVACVLFFLAEIGDKTQVATVLLAAQFHSIFWVMLGTTLGMLLANVPVVFAGEYLMARIPLKLTRVLAAAAFVIVGLIQILQIFRP